MASSRDVGNLSTEEVAVLNKVVFEEWDAKTTQMKKEADKINPEKLKNIKPEEIGVSFGPVMDEATFREYQKRREGRMNVISAADLQKMFGQRK
jgi:hypothetical protein